MKGALRARPEHPRLRGDHELAPQHHLFRRGTPPPARGPLLRSAHPVAGRRNTPACAGTTGVGSGTVDLTAEHPRLRGDHGRACPRTLWGAEHPRLRGDHFRMRVSSWTESGTPPPARGPQGGRGRHGRDRRNTPACAGTTRCSASTLCATREHPRLRGDHRAMSTASGHSCGTPPPARGPLGPREVPAFERRNTPACAGTTAARTASPRTGAEHPRLRGDHLGYRTGAVIEDGTPPPARGPRLHVLPVRVGPRNTPACAGTTKPSWSRTRVSPEHPRLRGDHFVSTITVRLSTGTPPPARGPPRPYGSQERAPRNTPACAGTTLLRRVPRYRSPEHPRLRGDHALVFPRGSWSTGTPPPARGPPRPG